MILLSYVVKLLTLYKYYFIVPLAFIEGPIVTIISGFFIEVGFMSFWPAYFCLFTGDLLGDIMWYSIGYKAGERFINRFGRFFGITDEKISVIKRIFHKHTGPILLVSKISMGFGFSLVTLVTAGLVKVPFKRFLFFDAIGQLVWTGILVWIGFLFGNFYTSIHNVFGELSVIALFIFAIFALFGFSKYIQGRTKKSYMQ